MSTLEVIALLFAGAMIGVAVTAVFIVATYRDKALVPRHKGTVGDLPPWAANICAELKVENHRLKQELAQRRAKSTARKARP